MKRENFACLGDAGTDIEVREFRIPAIPDFGDQVSQRQPDFQRPADKVKSNRAKLKTWGAFSSLGRVVSEHESLTSCVTNLSEQTEQ